MFTMPTGVLREVGVGVSLSIHFTMYGPWSCREEHPRDTPRKRNLCGYGAAELQRAENSNNNNTPTTLDYT
jgi:hypothetical protein